MINGSGSVVTRSGEMMKNKCSKTLAMIIGLTLAGTLPSQLRAESDFGAWHYGFQLYMVPTWIQGDAQLGYRVGQKEDSASMKLDVTPKDIFDNLEMGLMAHFEGRHDNHWGFWIDYAFMDLGKDAEIFRKPLKISSSAGVYQGVMEAIATRRSRLERGYIDYFAGIRWWHTSIDFVLDTALTGNGAESRDRSRTIDWYDPVVGAVWVIPLNEDWRLRLRGDIGGFNIGKASKFTSAVEIGALYDISDSWQLNLRFKSLWVDYEEGSKGKRNRYVYDTVTFGPVVGITYRF